MSPGSTVSADRNERTHTHTNSAHGNAILHAKQSCSLLLRTPNQKSCLFQGIARTRSPCPPSRRVAERPSRLPRELAADHEEPPEQDKERLGAKVYIERLKDQKGFVVRAAMPVVQRARTLHNVWPACKHTHNAVSRPRLRLPACTRSRHSTWIRRS